MTDGTCAQVDARAKGKHVIIASSNASKRMPQLPSLRLVPILRHLLGERDLGNRHLGSN